MLMGSWVEIQNSPGGKPVRDCEIVQNEEEASHPGGQ